MESRVKGSLTDVGPDNHNAAGVRQWASRAQEKQAGIERSITDTKKQQMLQKQDFSGLQ
jgi:hypothetical protein